MTEINTNLQSSSGTPVSEAGAAYPTTAGGGQTLHQQQQDTLEKSDVKQEAHADSSSSNVFLQQPEVQQAILSMMMAALLAQTSDSNSTTDSKETKGRNAVTANTGEGSSLNASQQQFLMTHQEGLQLVAENTVKKMLKSMPKDEVSTKIAMMFEKTKNDIICESWDKFGEQVRENEELNKAASLDHNIKQDDILKKQIHSNDQKYDRGEIK